MYCHSKMIIITNVYYFIFSGQEQGGYLVEASLSIEESSLQRNNWLMYYYGVKQRRKEITAAAARQVQIPGDPNIKGKSQKPFNASMSTLHCTVKYHTGI